jgi:hypothetical protein
VEFVPELWLWLKLPDKLPEKPELRLWLIEPETLTLLPLGVFVEEPEMDTLVLLVPPPCWANNWVLVRKPMPKVMTVPVAVCFTNLRRFIPPLPGVPFFLRSICHLYSQ